MKPTLKLTTKKLPTLQLTLKKKDTTPVKNVRLATNKKKYG